MAESMLGARGVCAVQRTVIDGLVAVWFDANYPIG